MLEENAGNEKLSTCFAYETNICKNIDNVNNNLRVIQISLDFIQMNSDMESSGIILPEE